MSFWWTRSEPGRTSTFAIEGLGFVVCLTLVIVLALIAWVLG